MNLKLYASISFSIVLLYGIMSIPIVDTADGAFPGFNFNFDKDKFLQAILDNHERIISEHDPTLSTEEQQTYLDGLQTHRKIVVAIVENNPEIKERGNILLEESQKILDEGIVSEPIIISDENGDVVLQLDDTAFELEFSTDFWECTTDEELSKTTCVRKMI